MAVQSQQSSSFESVSSARTAALESATRRAVEYLDGVNDRPVAPPPEAVAALDELRGPMPQDSTCPEIILDLLTRFGSPATIANSGGRYFGFVNGGCVPAAMAASWLVSVWDQNAAFKVQSPVAVALEEIALGWVR